jgi:hypothetical protein
MREYVMPTINETFHPPSSLYGAKPRPGLEGACLGYEILELPRRSTDEKAGFLTVGFRIEITNRSIMQYLDNEIDAYVEKEQGHHFRLW